MQSEGSQWWDAFWVIFGFPVWIAIGGVELHQAQANSNKKMDVGYVE